ncbi:MAG: ABC transporter ATP-binding protein [archaeon]
MNIIELENITKEYEDGNRVISALKDVSLNVKQGEMLAVMGPSGSGKSTLLSILGILNTPTRGIVSMDNIRVYDLNQEKQADFRFRNLGFVFQSYQLIPYLTAMENVMLPLSISKMPGEKQLEKAMDALRRVGLHGKENRLPDKLSGGEQQRVAIARAIVNTPKILLTDEPTGNLDSKTGDEILSLIKELNKGGQTIVMVTHDEKIAMSAHRIVHLRDGKLDREVKNG